MGSPSQWITVSGATKIQVANGANKLCSSSNATQMWGTAAGSDGDSMPESPLSLDDGKLPPSIRTTKIYSRLKYLYIVKSGTYGNSLFCRR